MGWILLAYFAGLLTIPAGWGLIILISWATARTTGMNGCYVCEHGPVSEIGERLNLSLWLHSKWHSYFWGGRKWHKEAWAKHWANRLRTVPTKELLGEKGVE